MKTLYTLGVLMYGAAVHFAALFNVKAKMWVAGRKNIFQKLESYFANNQSPVMWIHCASLGEFEQGRPLIESVRKKHPTHKILLTFFSPSGYEVRKNYAEADFVCYMPLDTSANAKRFLDIVKPRLAIFVKYEFWLNHLSELSKKQIPHYLISAIFRNDQIFFKSHGGIFREALKNYTHIFSQDENSRTLLSKIGIAHTSAAGDTRFDRVVEIANSAKDILLAAAFSGTQAKTLVAGSTWSEDESVLFPAMKNHFRAGWKMIIAPHEINEDRLISIESLLTENGVASEKIVRFSKATESSAAAAQVLVIDNIGMLSSLYRYGQVAYIGGGFGKSIHNTLEAAVYEIPVVFGPKYQKFNEALRLIECKGGFGVNSSSEIQLTLDQLLNDSDLRVQSGKLAGEFVKSNTGATKKILSSLKLLSA